MYELGELDRELKAAGIPIVGVSGTQGAVTVTYDPSASADQQTQGAGIVAGFDWTGAPLNYLRAAAGAALSGADQRLVRGVLLALLDQLNTIASQHDALLTWLGTQTTLTTRAQLNGFSLNQITAAQVRAAVVNKISSGAAD